MMRRSFLMWNFLRYYEFLFLFYIKTRHATAENSLLITEYSKIDDIYNLKYKRVVNAYLYIDGCNQRMVDSGRCMRLCTVRRLFSFVSSCFRKILNRS